MKRMLSLILAFVFIFGLFSNYSHALNIKLDYVNVKAGRDRGLDDKIRITGYNRQQLDERVPLALYDSNRNEIDKLKSNSMIDVVYNSENDRFDIFDWKGNYLIDIEPGKGNFIGPQEPDSSVLNANGRYYRGYVYFVKNTNKVNIVNHLGLQEYLYGVVPREMPAGSHLEALKAQAVTARSYAVANLNRHKSLGYDLCDTTDCQVYGGFHIRTNIGEHPNSNKAVDQTKDKVLTHNGKVIATYFHSNSGGHTENSENVWSASLPYIRGVKDPYSENTIRSTWEKTFTTAEIEGMLKKAGHNVGKLQDIEIINRTLSGRVDYLKLIGSEGEKTIRGTHFRTALDSDVFMSTWFDMEKIKSKFEGKASIIDRLDNIITRSLNGLSVIGGDRRVRKISGPVTVIAAENEKSTLGSRSSEQYKFTGKGYGHGLGMSQHGAMEMGKQGFKYDQILKHYFTDVNIETINQ